MRSFSNRGEGSRASLVRSASQSSLIDTIAAPNAGLTSRVFSYTGIALSSRLCQGLAVASTDPLGRFVSHLKVQSYETDNISCNASPTETKPTIFMRPRFPLLLAEVVMQKVRAARMRGFTQHMRGVALGLTY